MDFVKSYEYKNRLNKVLCTLYVQLKTADALNRSNIRQQISKIEAEIKKIG